MRKKKKKYMRKNRDRKWEAVQAAARLRNMARLSRAVRRLSAYPQWRIDHPKKSRVSWAELEELRYELKELAELKELKELERELER